MNKYRHEFKYIITNAQMAEIQARIKPIMSFDSHCKNGIYNIRSLYFDDYNNTCLNELVDGVNDRSKFRLRIYDTDDSRISFERKDKHNGMTLKYIKIVQKDEVIPELIAYNLHPVVIVDYDRVPYVYGNGNVRITFDTNISSCGNVNSFYNNRILKRPVMPKGWQLMEVKFDEYIPDVIYKALEIRDLRQTRYSKYYMCRRYSL